MGIVRLAKCLRQLNSLTEYDTRESDIKNKISGNRIYMDFVSIVYKIQLNIANELNYLLISFILLKMNLLNDLERSSDKFKSLIKKYNIDNEQLDTIDDKFIDTFKENIRKENIMNQYIYKGVIEFIVDILTNKLTDVEYVLISFDGIPSFGKIQEQRQRRYMKYTYIEFQKLINKTSDNISDKTSDDRSILGARAYYDKDHFYVDVRSAIEYVYAQYHNSNLQKDIADEYKKNKIIIEIIDKPYGEGEKILMDRIIQDYQKYLDTKTYIFYSPDGDSVILSLYIYIKTKIKCLNVIKSYTMEPSERHNEQTQYVDIKNLYDNIVNIVEKFTKDTYDVVEDKDNICTDIILLINLFGNDFIHQIPTMEISSTFMDLMYVYSKYIRDNPFITRKIDNRIHPDYESLRDFFKSLADFEQFMILDTYMADLENKNKIVKYFGNVFSFRYLLDYKDSVDEIKKDIHIKLKNGESNINNIKEMISDAISILNNKITVTGKKYGEIWTKIEVKSIGDYSSKILSDPDFLLARFPRFIHQLRTRKNRSEDDIMDMVERLESDLIKSNISIDMDKIFSSNDKNIRDFAFDYQNIRNLVPHDQMPTSQQDIDLYLLDWKSGKWMNIINSNPFDLGYDWKHGKPKKLEHEMKRYQYDMLEINNMDKMVTGWLKTFSWMCDYYMNTDYTSTTTEISTWSYGYDRSPFISHISNFLNKIDTRDMKNIMKGVYKKSLVSFDNYLKTDKHRLYIYPQSSDIIKSIPDKYKIYFPDMLEYVNHSINLAKNTNSHIDKKSRVFDCRLCPYFSKCIFKSKHMTFNELMSFNMNPVIENKPLKSNLLEPDEKRPKSLKKISFKF